MSKHRSWAWLIPALAAAAMLALLALPPREKVRLLWPAAGSATVCLLARTDGNVAVDDVEAAALLEDFLVKRGTMTTLSTGSVAPSSGNSVVVGPVPDSFPGAPAAALAMPPAGAVVVRRTLPSGRTWTVINAPDARSRLAAVRCLVETRCMAGLRTKAAEKDSWLATIDGAAGTVLSFQPLD